MNIHQISLVALGLTTSCLSALEAPEKIEPLAPNQAPRPAEVAPEAVAEEAAIPEIVAEELPAPEKQPAAPKAAEEMPLVQEQNAYIGLGLEPVPDVLAKHLGLDAATCAMVRILDPEGPAAAAGLQESDIILGVDGKKVKSHECLSKMMGKYKAGTEVELTFIHRGKEEKKMLTLAARPADQIAGMDNAAPGIHPLQREMFKNLPPEMREALEKNLRALEAGGGMPVPDIQVMPLDENALPDLQKRMEKMLKGMKQMDPGAQAAPGGIQMNMNMKSTLKMMDAEGNIEISRDGESCEAKVYNKQGELLWMGPYMTPQDKAAIPPPIRERLDALNVDTNGKGIQLRMMPRR